MSKDNDSANYKTKACNFRKRKLFTNLVFLILSSFLRILKFYVRLGKTVSVLEKQRPEWHPE